MSSTARKYVDNAVQYEQIQKKETITGVRSNRKKPFVTGVNIFQCVVCAIAIIGLSGLSVYHQIEKTELGDQIAKKEIALTNLQKENTLIEEQLQNIYNNIEIAELSQNNFIMGKSENYQTEYICVSCEDSVSRVNTEGQYDIISKIKRMWSRLFA